MATQQYEVVVPAGVQPGQAFQINIGGQLMQIACPANARGGMKHVQLKSWWWTAVEMPTTPGASFPSKRFI